MPHLVEPSVNDSFAHRRSDEQDEDHLPLSPVIFDTSTPRAGSWMSAGGTSAAQQSFSSAATSAATTRELRHSRPKNVGIPDVIDTTPSRRPPMPQQRIGTRTPPPSSRYLYAGRGSLPGEKEGNSSSSTTSSGSSSPTTTSTAIRRAAPIGDRFWMRGDDGDDYDDRDFMDGYPGGDPDNNDTDEIGTGRGTCAIGEGSHNDDPPPSYDEDRERMLLLDPYYHHHVPPPPVPSPCVRSVRSKQRRGHHHRRASASAVERRRSSHKQQAPQVPEQHHELALRASSSSSASSANAGGGYPSSSCRSSSSGHCSSGSRRSSSQQRSHSHHHPPRRSTGRSSSGRRRSEMLTTKDLGWHRWCCLWLGGGKGRSRMSALSSSQALFRMISFAGILSVSLTALANRNLLLVQVDPTASSSPTVVLRHQQHHPLQKPNSDRHHVASTSRTTASSAASSLLSLSSTAFSSQSVTSSGRLRGRLFGPPRESGATNHELPASGARAAVANSHGAIEAKGGRVPRRQMQMVTTADLASVSARAEDAVSSPLLLPTLTGKQDDASSRSQGSWTPIPVVLPMGKLPGEAKKRFDAFDRNLYINRALSSTTPSTPTSMSSASDALPSPVWNRRRRVAVLHDEWNLHSKIAQHRRRKLQLYPPDITDPTQLYPVLDSRDERAKTMERRPPLEDGECIPMSEWQTTYHPSCNQLHESLDVSAAGVPKEQSGAEFWLFGTKGYWRNAWKVKLSGPRQRTDTMVLKTLKIEHRFEEKVYEHNRIDAIAMERLTRSPHVINIFGFCGNSVLTEYADGKRLGELADKSKKEPLARLRIARDIAQGLADVHGIDGDGNATFVHLDINPANVVSIGGTLKLNDFNIGIIRRRNRTSGAPCGFPAQYPNPQWRSPEEARGESNLTEKVDVFSMGHIFFRLICGHEPWNKLEPGGKPGKAEVNDKVEKGILPHIPREIRQSTDPEEVAIRDVMLRCYTFDPEKRPSARYVASYLQEKLDRLEAEHNVRAFARA